MDGKVDKKYKFKHDDIIKKLCKQYGIKKIIDMNHKEHKLAYKNMYGNKILHVNNSFQCGDTIIIGFYLNPNIKLLSVLHEIGHILVNKDYKCRYDLEKDVWDIAFDLAKQNNIRISNSSYNWCLKQLKTYK